jgi:hypothetical protein
MDDWYRHTEDLFGIQGHEPVGAAPPWLVPVLDRVLELLRACSQVRTSQIPGNGGEGAGGAAAWMAAPHSRPPQGASVVATVSAWAWWGGVTSSVAAGGQGWPG